MSKYLIGLEMQFNSSVSSKINLISMTLIDRAYKINSSYHNLCTEFENFRRFFFENRFSISMVGKYISEKTCLYL